MAKEAKVRLSLDLTRARADLAAFYGMLRSAPNITPGASGGGGGGGGGPGVGAIAAGTFLGQAAHSAGSILLRSQAARTTIESVKDELFAAMAGEDAVGRMAQATASRGTVSQRFGKLAAMELIDENFARQQFELEERYGAGLQAKGERIIRGWLGSEVAGEVGGAALSAIKNLITEFIPKLAQGIGEEIAKRLNPFT